MNRSTELANILLEKHGYVIMAFSAGPKPVPHVGMVVSDPLKGTGADEVRGPFMVVGESTESEWVAQAESVGLIGELPPNVLAYLKLVAE